MEESKSHHRRKSSVEEENDWVFDYVMSYLKSPEWENVIMSFIDENCCQFGNFMNDKYKEEISFEEYTIYQNFQEKVDSLLSAYLEEVGLDIETFVSICGDQLSSSNIDKNDNDTDKDNENNVAKDNHEREEGGTEEGKREKQNESEGNRSRKRRSRTINKEVLAQLFSMSDFAVFRKLMIKRNVEIEMEALEQLGKDWDEEMEIQMRTKRHNTRVSMDTSFGSSEFDSEYALKRRDSIKKAEEKYESTRNRLEGSDSENEDEENGQDGEEREDQEEEEGRRQTNDQLRGSKTTSRKQSGSTLSFLSISKWNPFNSLGDIQKEEKQVAEDLEDADYELAIALARSMEELAVTRSLEDSRKESGKASDVMSRFKEAGNEAKEGSQIKRLENLHSNNKPLTLASANEKVSPNKEKSTNITTTTTTSTDQAPLSHRLKSSIENNPTALKTINNGDSGSSSNHDDSNNSRPAVSMLASSKDSPRKIGIGISGSTEGREEKIEIETKESSSDRVQNTSSNSSLSSSLSSSHEQIDIKNSNGRAEKDLTLSLTTKRGKTSRGTKIKSPSNKRQNEKEKEKGENILPPIQFFSDFTQGTNVSNFNQLPVLSKSKGTFQRTTDNPFSFESKKMEEEEERNNREVLGYEADDKSKNENENLTDQILEMEKRREYLKKQRDIIVEKKKKEREEKLRQHNFEKEQQERNSNIFMTESDLEPTQLYSYSNKSASDEDQKEQEERFNRAQKDRERAFLVKKIKQEVLDSESF